MHLRLALLVALLLAAVSVSFIDVETAMEHRVREVIAKSHWQGTYENLGEGWFEFKTDHGPTFRKYVGDARTQGGMIPKRIQILDVRTIDTIGFSARFYSIGVIPIGSAYQGIVGLNGKSGSVYLIGGQHLWPGFKGTQVLQTTGNLDSCPIVYTYPDLMVPVAMSSFHDRNLPHLTGDASGRSYVYETLEGWDYPTRRITTRDGKSSNAQKVRTADFDNDGFDEILIRNDIELSNPRVHISRYDTARKVFVDTFKSPYDKTAVWGSFAVGDYDRDGYKEFAFAATPALVFMGEHRIADTGYVITMTDTTRMVNTGWNCEGGDLDDDGRPECFIGSEYFGGPYNIAVYQAIGHANYEVTLWLEIRGMGGFAGGMVAGDVDGDGREELVACFGGVAVILKATTDGAYSVYWMKSFASEIIVSLFDVDGDGAKEVFIGRFNGGDGVTEVFRFNRKLAVEPMPVSPRELRLSSPYPSPCTTAINGTAALPRGSQATLSLHALSGRVLRRVEYPVMQDRRETAFRLDCADIPQGMYFLTLSSGTGSVVKKVMVMH